MAVSREGVDGPENRVTTSMNVNSAKARWTLEERASGNSLPALNVTVLMSERSAD